MPQKLLAAKLHSAQPTQIQNKDPHSDISYLWLARLKWTVPHYVTIRTDYYMRLEGIIASLVQAGIPYLVFVVVELIAVAGLEHFEAVWAQKISGVLVELTEVNYNVIVERRAEIANLNNKKIPHVQFLKNRIHYGHKFFRQIRVYLTHVGHFPRLVKVFHVMQKEGSVLKMQLTDFAECCKKGIITF